MSSLTLCIRNQDTRLEVSKCHVEYIHIASMYREHTHITLIGNVGTRPASV